MKNLINIAKCVVLLTLTLGCLPGYAQNEYNKCMALHAKGEVQIANAQAKWDKLSEYDKDKLPQIPSELEAARAASGKVLEGCTKIKALEALEPKVENVLVAGAQFLNGALGESKDEPKPESKEDKVVTYTFSEDDTETARVLKDTIRAGSYEGKCILVTVVSNNRSYSRDLAATSVGDLADGAVVIRRNVVNEVGAIAFKAGPNSVITLQEDNSNMFFTSMTEKASGKGIDEFASNAAKAGYLVSYENGYGCLGTARDEDLAKAAQAHIKALRAKRDRLVSIAKR